MEGVVLTWYWCSRIESGWIREKDRQYLCWIPTIVQLVHGSIIIYDITTVANVTTYVHYWAVKGIEAVYLGVNCYFGVFSKDLLNLVASVVYAG